VIDPNNANWDSLDEEQQIEAAKRDPDALSVLYRRHYATIHRFVSRRVATSHDVNDIVSDVFLTMVQSLPRFRWTGAPFQSWLFRIATSQISRWVRKRKWTRFWAPFEDQIVGSQERTESELVRRLRKALLELPTKYQHTLSLFYLEDLPIKSIAEILDVEQGTVKARLSRGRQLLKEKLDFTTHQEIRNEQRPTTSLLERTKA
jgi:RNA polymerase sigma-70 factor, ECF subfamily